MSFLFYPYSLWGEARLQSGTDAPERARGVCMHQPTPPIHPLPMLLVLHLAQSHLCNNTGSIAFLITAVCKREGCGEKGSRCRWETGIHKAFPLRLRKGAREAGWEADVAAFPVGWFSRTTRAYTSSCDSCSLAPLNRGAWRRKPKANTAAFAAQARRWGKYPPCYQHRKANSFLLSEENPPIFFRWHDAPQEMVRFARHGSRDAGEHHECTEERTGLHHAMSLVGVSSRERSTQHMGLRHGYKQLAHKLLPPAQLTPHWVADVSVQG